MNSSKIIKSARQVGSHAILVSRTAGKDQKESGFHALSSLWQSDDEGMAAALSELETERQKLRDEAERVRSECQAMLAEAKAEAGRIEQEARDRGFATGKTEAQEEEKRRLAQFAAQLDSLLATIDTDRRRLHQQYEADILTLIKAMVERVLFSEVTTNPQAIEICLKTALGYVVENSAVTVRLHGQDLERLRQVIMARPEMVAGYRRLELTEDPAIEPGGCLLETSFGEIDATLESRRAKVCAAIDAVLQQAARKLA
jgi:flagellar assembly protein FliH